MNFRGDLEDWEYDPSAPGGMSDKDKVRFKIGDIYKQRKLLTDSEINLMIEEYDDLHTAAYYCAVAISNFAAGFHDTSAEGVNESVSQVYKHYKEVAEHLLATSPLQIPTAPALRYSRRRELTQDTDLVLPPFHIGMLTEDRASALPGTTPIDTDEREQTD
jgi:hypothetical protein